MLELLTKEYIVASILAWLQTLYFSSKSVEGTWLKSKTTSCLQYDRHRNSCVHVSRGLKNTEACFPFVFGGPAIWFLLCAAGRRALTVLPSYALKSARRFEAILSLLFGLRMDVLITRGILSLKEPESNSFASLKSFKPWSMLVFLSICLINIVRHFDSGWQKMAESLRTIPIPLLGRLIFVHWVPCRIWRKHNTTSIHKMKQIITRERKTKYKNSESNPIMDDRHNRM